MKILTATALLLAIALPATAQAIPSSDSNLTNYQRKPLTRPSLGQDMMMRPPGRAIAPGNRIKPVRIEQPETMYLPPTRVTPLPRRTIVRPVYKH